MPIKDVRAFFVNNSRSKQNKKNLEHSFVDFSNWEACAKFQQKILNSMVAGARQIFQFFRQNTWFLENGASSKFSYDIFLYSISINKL